MDLQNFITKNSFLYHLTSRENLENILEKGRLMSTSKILQSSNLSNEERTKYLTERRPEHIYVEVDGKEVMVRDQRPISLKALSKCLTDGWSCEQFIQHLNERVFFWPTLKRLNIHFSRYEAEEPVILRVKSEKMLQINNHVKFCRLNSGATRCLPYYDGAPPPRGPQSFLRSHEFNYTPSDVAEVTFEDECQLPRTIWISNNPMGAWREI